MLTHQGFFVFYMKNSSRLIGNLIIAVWLVLLALLVRKHISIPVQPLPLPATARLEAERREEWHGVYKSGKKIGYTQALRQKTETGYRFTERAVLHLSMMGIPQRIVTALDAETDSHFRLCAFEFSIHTDSQRFQASGRITGTRLHLKTETGETSRQTSINLQAVPVLADSLTWSLIRNGLRVGQTATQPIFDPLTMATMKATAKVEAQEDIVVQGRSTACFRVRHTYNGLTVYSWLNQQGETVKEESPLGFLLQQEPPATAAQGIAADAPLDIIAETAIPVNSPITKREVDYLKLRLRNIALAGFSLEGTRQKRTGDILEIYRETLTAADTFRLPLRNRELQPYLAASPSVQSDDQTIVQTARSILQEETDARRAAQLICSWVYATIEKIPTMSIPRATEVLRVKRGDCNEHAVLYAALCRAAGIPAKTCGGIVYLDGAFYFHAWVEIYLQRWRSQHAAISRRCHAY